MGGTLEDFPKAAISFHLSTLIPDEPEKDIRVSQYWLWFLSVRNISEVKDQNIEEWNERRSAVAGVCILYVLPFLLFVPILIQFSQRN